MSIQASTAALRQICQRLFLRQRSGPRHPASGRIRLEVAVRAIRLAAVGFLLFSATEGQCIGAPAQQENKPLSFEQLLQKMVEFPADPCDLSDGKEADWKIEEAQYHLFRSAVDRVEQELNETPQSAESPFVRATQALKELEHTSAEINAAWPEENRFHFQVLDLTQALVVKMTIRTVERFFVFGQPQEQVHGEGDLQWREVGSNDSSFDHDFPAFWVELFPLQRGPSGKARFLARSEYTGCAGSIGIAYDAREWNPEGTGSLDQIIDQSGSFGLSDDVPDFPLIGKLKTEGPLITLPYCSFSAIDTWDNPSLCAVDTYDLSGDNVQFRSREYNRPDFVPIVKVIEYAQKHDYDAVLAYCSSSEVALKLVRGIEPHFFAEDVRVTSTGNGEHIEMGDGADNFDVEELAGRWVVVAFSVGSAENVE